MTFLPGFNSRIAGFFYRIKMDQVLETTARDIDVASPSVDLL